MASPINQTASKSGRHHVFRTLKMAGMKLEDLLPAYPGHTAESLYSLLEDNSHTFSRYVLPYGVLGTHPCRSETFNITPHGFRSNGKFQIWPPDPKKTNIFVFGGSTTLGASIADHETIPSRLGKILGKSNPNIEVYNFGAGSYNSRDEFMLFMHLVENGHVPDHAIFLDGFNDTQLTLWNDDLITLLDNLFQSEKRRRRMSYLRSLIDYAISSWIQRKKLHADFFHYKIPILTEEEKHAYLSDAAVEHVLKTCHELCPAEELTAFHERIGSAVWQRYQDSKKLIQGLAERNHIQTSFFWQPVPCFGTTPNQRLDKRLFSLFRQGILPYYVYNWLHHRVFNAHPQDPSTNGIIDFTFIGTPLDEILYVDNCHYTAGFSSAIAQAIAEHLPYESEVVDRSQSFSPDEKRPSRLSSALHPSRTNGSKDPLTPS